MSNRRGDTGPVLSALAAGRLLLAGRRVAHQHRPPVAFDVLLPLRLGGQGGDAPVRGIDDERRARTRRLRRAEDGIVGPPTRPARSRADRGRSAPGRPGAPDRGRRAPRRSRTPDRPARAPARRGCPRRRARSPRDPDVPTRSCRSPAPPPGPWASWKITTTAASAVATPNESSSCRFMFRPPRSGESTRPS